MDIAEVSEFQRLFDLINYEQNSKSCFAIEGYIFPLFCSGTALGRAIHCVMPWIDVQLCTLCMAASMNVALTRTAIATTLILSYLSGEQAAISAILASSLISLFVTAYMPFIKSQVNRPDISYAIQPNRQSLREIEDMPSLNDILRSAAASERDHTEPLNV